MTNGVVSVTRNGKVIVKAVAGCDGMRADRLAGIIRDRGLTTASQVMDAANEIHFGCAACRVVQDESETLFGDNEELGPLYREKFSDPAFNPRWHYGTAAYVRIVELESER